MAGVTLAALTAYATPASAPAANAASPTPAAMAAAASEPAAVKKASTSTADHSKFKELQKTFTSAPEVTKACLICHTEAAKQVQQTKHWTWEFINPETQQKLGKKHIINNFCTATKSNEKFCTACHVGYGWENDKFDFTGRRETSTAWCATTPPASTANFLVCRAIPPIRIRSSLPHSGKIVKAPDLKQSRATRRQNQSCQLRRLPLLWRWRRCGETRRSRQHLDEPRQVSRYSHGEERPELQL